MQLVSNLVSKKQCVEDKKSSLLDFHLNTLEMLVNVKTNSKTIDFYLDSIMEKKGLNKQQFESLFFLN